MDDAYYEFTLANSEIVDGLHLANEVALICLKARAFLNNRQRKIDGQDVQEVDIVKHKNDVIKLVSTLPPAQVAAIPAIVKADLQQYIQVVREENVNVKVLLRPMVLGGITLSEIIERMQVVFGLES
jgi:FlaA1/EpsC-like NDP-sugar epimerase